MIQLWRRKQLSKQSRLDSIVGSFGPRLQVGSFFYIFGIFCFFFRPLRPLYDLAFSLTFLCACKSPLVSNSNDNDISESADSILFVFSEDCKTLQEVPLQKTYLQSRDAWQQSSGWRSSASTWSCREFVRYRDATYCSCWIGWGTSSASMVSVEWFQCLQEAFGLQRLVK